MIFQIIVLFTALLVGIGIGAWLNMTISKWEIQNKEPNPSLVRDRKEIVAAIFVVICIAILVIGIATKDSHGGLSLLAISIVPLLFLFFELLDARNEDKPRGFNAVGYFVFNVVLYGAIRILNWIPGLFENLSAMYTIAFFELTLGTVIIDVIVTGVSAFLSSDNDTAGNFQRALPIYLKTYAIMLAILGLLLIISK